MKLEISFEKMKGLSFKERQEKLQKSSLNDLWKCLIDTYDVRCSHVGISGYLADEVKEFLLAESPEQEIDFIYSVTYSVALAFHYTKFIIERGQKKIKIEISSDERLKKMKAAFFELERKYDRSNCSTEYEKKEALINCIQEFFKLIECVREEEEK